jgi:hypothetical protein
MITEEVKQYNLVNNNDANDIVQLEATTFDEAVEEALYHLRWYIINEGIELYVGVSVIDPNDTYDLTSDSYEDAQYELIEHLGYFISTTV